MAKTVFLVFSLILFGIIFASLLLVGPSKGKAIETQAVEMEVEEVIEEPVIINESESNITESNPTEELGDAEINLTVENNQTNITATNQTYTNATDNRNRIDLGISKKIGSHIYDIFKIEEDRVRIKQDNKTSDWIYEDQQYLFNLTKTKIVVVDIFYQPYYGGNQAAVFVFNGTT